MAILGAGAGGLRLSKCHMILCGELGGTSGREPRSPTFARAGQTWGAPGKSESKGAAHNCGHLPFRCQVAADVS
jgi:hypothetical protein